MKNKLYKYASSTDIMDVCINFNGQKIKFNLYQELIIIEDVVNREVKNQSVSYAFLLILHKRLLAKLADAEFNLKKAKAKLWATSKDGQEKRVTKDDIKSQIDSNPKILLKEKQVNDLQADCNILEACVKAFDQRSNQLQTLSANLRRTTN